MFKLTTENCAAMYDFLVVTEPFVKWNLPDSEDVIFRIFKDSSCMGWYVKENGRHVLGMSASRIGQSFTLMRVMAHEMIHLHQEHAGFAGKSEHGRAFYKLSSIVARHHGFDPKEL